VWAVREPLSADHDPGSRARRLRRVHRDIALYLAGQACPGCGQWARLAGGHGCDCATRGDLAARCWDVAAGACHCPGRAP
jgi:hypothetical protein